MTHPWILGGIGVINKQKIIKKLNNEFINYDGPLHFASKKQYIKAKEFYKRIFLIKNLQRDLYEQARSQLALIAND